ncbi:GTP 3',8-cyclase MoaA [Gordonia westfalica]|uniref:GTP 3',8-cyclase n=1 Tax=Gordonia westfalica TaxID=158898 RepID=A0ABU2GZ51_9ACTN|nr:GTP 3',8-cyclase MoaA [Gordonia westfalica]MDS1116741.1 GTP 3',8-cyclase MoaA [Gordonia westfalica]
MPSIRSEHVPDGSGRPNVAYLIDRHGRVARDLRVSLTERCSLRCTYCMPEEGLPPIAADKLLSADEVVRLTTIAVRELGISEIRFTGGEPLIRRDLEDIIAGCSQANPGTPISMTTNGVGLKRRAKRLARAGLTRVNISLDTVDRQKFAELTRRDRLPAVLAGIEAAVAAGLAPVKINAVLMPDNIDGAVDLLAWCVDRALSLRFIEQMPLDHDRGWQKATMIDAQTLLTVLARRFGLEPIGRADPSAPAEEWLVDGGPSTVGVIASVTRSFCQDCDRTRLTAEGTVRSCLFSDAETDLRETLRTGGSDAELAELWRYAMWEKSAGHGIASEGFTPPVRTMGAIGG